MFCGLREKGQICSISDESEERKVIEVLSGRVESTLGSAFKEVVRDQERSPWGVNSLADRNSLCVVRNIKSWEME